MINNHDYYPKLAKYSNKKFKILFEYLNLQYISLYKFMFDIFHKPTATLFYWKSFQTFMHEMTGD